MEMATIVDPPSLARGVGPIAWLGRLVVSLLQYMGGVAILSLAAILASFKAGRRSADIQDCPSVRSELAWMLLAGFPLVGLVHVGMGSFLSMQAYFGSTFVDGTGAVVGVGLLRNLATLMTGMVLAGLLPVRIICELASGTASTAERVARPADRETNTSGRQSPEGISSWQNDDADTWASVTAPRIVAASLASVMLSLWGVVVGTVVGWQASGTLLGLSSEMFFVMMRRMIWYRDVVGMIVKGIGFGLIPASICCYEGLGLRASASRLASGAAPAGQLISGPIGVAMVRAACVGMISILLGNMAWFIFVYHAVSSYGPSLLAPPGP